MFKLSIAIFSIVLASIIGGQAAFANTTDQPTAGAPQVGRAMFAAGCFWKVQYVFSRLPGVLKTRVGYSGGTLPHPTYEQVCADNTGHAETVLVEYDPAKTTYRKLLEAFWKNHDPTTPNRQGPDIGTQYRSVVFYTTPEQQKEAMEYKAELERERRFNGRIVTAIEPAGQFFEAEEYHQDYYAKHGAVCY